MHFAVVWWVISTAEYKLRAKHANMPFAMASAAECNAECLQLALVPLHTVGVRNMVPFFNNA
jgi:hypothetical protein